MSIFGSASSARPQKFEFTGPFCFPQGTAQSGTATTSVANKRIVLGGGQTVDENTMLDEWACVTLDSGAKEVRRIIHVYPASNELELEEALSGVATGTAWTLIGHHQLASDVSISNEGGANATILGQTFIPGKSESYSDSNSVEPIYGDATGTTIRITSMSSKQIVK